MESISYALLLFAASVEKATENILSVDQLKHAFFSGCNRT